VIAGRGAAIAVLGLAGLLLTIAATSAWSGASRLGDRADEREAVELAAANFVVAIGSFDYRDPGGYTTRLVALTAGELRREIAAAEIDPVAAMQRRSIGAAVESVTVTALADGVAVVAVEATQQRRWIDATSQQFVEQNVRQRVSCRLVRKDGRWLVGELLLLSQQPEIARSAR
jgi:hypothetical protein